MNDAPTSLLERLRKPEQPGSWDRFVDLIAPLLFAWSRRLGLQAGEAADLVQDVLLFLLRELPDNQFDSSQSFRGWLRSVLLKKWRQNQRRTVPGKKADRPALEEVADPVPQSERDREEYRNYLVGRTLEMLRPEFPAGTWEAFQCHALRGEDPRQVAAHLKVKPGTVLAARARVLARLKQELRGMLD